LVSAVVLLHIDLDRRPALGDLPIHLDCCILPAVDKLLDVAVDGGDVVGEEGIDLVVQEVFLSHNHFRHRMSFDVEDAAEACFRARCLHVGELHRLVVLEVDTDSAQEPHRNNWDCGRRHILVRRKVHWLLHKQVHRRHIAKEAVESEERCNFAVGLIDVEAGRMQIGYLAGKR